MEQYIRVCDVIPASSLDFYSCEEGVEEQRSCRGMRVCDTVRRAGAGSVSLTTSRLQTISRCELYNPSERRTRRVRKTWRLVQTYGWPLLANGVPVQGLHVLTVLRPGTAWPSEGQGCPPWWRPIACRPPEADAARSGLALAWARGRFGRVTVGGLGPARV